MTPDSFRLPTPTFADFYFIANGRTENEKLLEEDKVLLKEWELSDEEERSVIGFSK